MQSQSESESEAISGIFLFFLHSLIFNLFLPFRSLIKLRVRFNFITAVDSFLTFLYRPAVVGDLLSLNFNIYIKKT